MSLSLFGSWRGCLAAWLLAAGCMGNWAHAQPVEVVDHTGRTLRFETLPQRWVSLLPSLTESTWALGGGPKLVGLDRYSNWPVELKDLPRLGGMDDTQIEALVRLKPDLVLASTSSRATDRLEALGIRVLRMKSETHTHVQQTLQVLARLLGQPSAADALWQSLQAEMSRQAQRVPPGWRGRAAYFEIGGGPYAAGRSSFIGETLQRLGLGNVVPVELGPFPKLNPEFVVRARPDLILGSRSQQAALRDRPGWAAVPAVQRGAVCGFDAAQNDVLVRPGPRLAEAATLIVDCLRGLPPP